ncbi:MAG: dienelactone hydrolase family protein [Candidatus Protochlamydia sp.]|nr:dienelactone hydrolase family protein [Candidatus Protochlamydia sp.]
MKNVDNHFFESYIEFNNLSPLVQSIEKTIEQVYKEVNQTVINEKINSKSQIPLKDRRLYHVLPVLKEGAYLVGHSKIEIEIPESIYIVSKSNKIVGIEIFTPQQINSVHSTAKNLFKMNPDNYNVIKDMRRDFENPLNLTEEQTQTLFTHSISGLPAIENLPIVIFSHGMGVDPHVYRPLLEELASQGNIVLNLNHPASSACAAFAKEEGHDWEFFKNLYSGKAEDIDEKAEEMAESGAANICFVVDLIQKGNFESFPKNFDSTKKIILAGHSLGGASSIMAARKNLQIAACIDLDGRLAGKKEIRSFGLSVPVLILSTEHDEPIEEAELELEAFLASSKDCTQKIIKGVGHMDFTLYPILDWLLGGTHLEEGLKAHHEASVEMLNFIKKI